MATAPGATGGGDAAAGAAGPATPQGVSVARLDPQHIGGTGAGADRGPGLSPPSTGASTTPPANVPAAHLLSYAWLLNNKTLSDVMVRVGCGVYGTPTAGPSADAGDAGERVARALNELQDPPPSPSPAADTAAHEENIYAHKAVLAVHSQTYRTMFETEQWAESAAGVVPMYYTRETCFCVLRHMYCCDQELSVAHALEVYDAALYYELPLLREMTVRFLAATVTVDTVVDYLCAAVRYADRSLRELCVAYIRRGNAMHSILYSDEDLFKVPKSVLVILIEETVIDSDYNILRRLHAWAEHQHEVLVAATRERGEQGKRCGEDEEETRTVALDTVPSAGDILAPFLPFINFTKMSRDELAHVETIGTVPLELLYRCFRNRVLGVDDGSAPRRGGLQLRWDDSHAQDLRSVECDTHLKKDRADGWEHVTALNKFSDGTHYWVYTVHDLRHKHDCIVGVSARKAPFDTFPTGVDADSILYEPCCHAVHAPRGHTVKFADRVDPATRGNRVSIGIALDFPRNTVSFYQHDTGVLLFTVTQDALAAPLYPCTSLFYRDNGGVSLSETTTFRTDRDASPGLCGSCGSASPLKSPTAIRGFMRTPESSAGGSISSPGITE